MASTSFINLILKIPFTYTYNQSNPYSECFFSFSPSVTVNPIAEITQLKKNKEKDINEKDEKGWTALGYAISRGLPIEIIACLIEQGADINAVLQINEYEVAHLDHNEPLDKRLWGKIYLSRTDKGECYYEVLGLNGKWNSEFYRYNHSENGPVPSLSAYWPKTNAPVKLVAHDPHFQTAISGLVRARGHIERVGREFSMLELAAIQNNKEMVLLLISKGAYIGKLNNLQCSKEMKKLLTQYQAVLRYRAPNPSHSYDRLECAISQGYDILIPALLEQVKQDKPSYRFWGAFNSACGFNRSEHQGILGFLENLQMRFLNWKICVWRKHSALKILLKNGLVPTCEEHKNYCKRLGLTVLAPEAPQPAALASKAPTLVQVEQPRVEAQASSHLKRSLSKS